MQALTRWVAYPPASTSTALVPKHRAYCETCDRTFSSQHVLLEHFRNSSMHIYCTRCDKHFESRKHMEKHMRASKSHFLCEKGCNVDFLTHEDLVNHYSLSGRHSFCILCQILFEDDDLLEAHIEQEHYACWACDVFYSTSDDLQEHFNRNESHPWCSTCSKGFRDDHTLDIHRASAKNHFWCLLCTQDFGSANNLLAHFQSPIHMGQVIVCPYCARTYQTHSSLVSHMESGTCESGMINRKKLDKKIRRIDTFNVITNPNPGRSESARLRHLLESPPDPYRASLNRPSNALVLASKRSHPKPHEVLTTYGEDLIATNLSWNGAYFECPLCYKEFTTLSSLNTHLANSHSGAMYKCPDSRTCGRSFKTLSELVRHVENENCGVVKFGRWTGSTKETVENITERFRELETAI